MNKNCWSYKLHKLGTPKVLRTDGRTDGRTEWATTRPPFAKATQVKMTLLGIKFDAISFYDVIF